MIYYTCIKAIVCIVLSAGAIMFCTSYASCESLDKSKAWYDEKVKVTQQQYEEYDRVANQVESALKGKNKAVIKPLMLQLSEIDNKLDDLANDVYDKYKLAVATDAHSEAKLGLLYHEAVSGSRCRYKIVTAMYYHEIGGKENTAIAKQRLRSIITTYTGFAFKSCVKQAEFALEDLK
jgi:hypothetical protein